MRPESFTHFALCLLYQETCKRGSCEFVTGWGGKIETLQIIAKSRQALRAVAHTEM